MACAIRSVYWGPAASGVGLGGPEQLHRYCRFHRSRLSADAPLGLAVCTANPRPRQHQASYPERQRLSSSAADDRRRAEVEGDPSAPGRHSSADNLDQAGMETASLIFRNLGSYPRQDGPAVTLRKLGQIGRTPFTRDWLQSVERK